MLAMLWHLKGVLQPKMISQNYACRVVDMFTSHFR